jgi:hypothetical protein
MKRTHFYVVHEDGRWNVRHEDQFIGPFASQEAAMIDAVSKAKAWCRAGIESRVLVRGEDNAVRMAWTSANRDDATTPMPQMATALVARSPHGIVGTRAPYHPRRARLYPRAAHTGIR